LAIDAKLEAELLGRFVTPRKRERCVGFVCDARTRSKVFEELRQPAIFDVRRVIEIPSGERTAKKLIERFRQLGMAGRVYVMSSNAEWDGNKFQMSWLVAQLVGAGFDSLAYCWKSKTGFYEQHHSGFTYFLR
jgi:hypothetical protein